MFLLVVVWNSYLLCCRQSRRSQKTQWGKQTTSWASSTGDPPYLFLSKNVSWCDDDADLVLMYGRENCQDTNWIKTWKVQVPCGFVAAKTLQIWFCVRPPVVPVGQMVGWASTLMCGCRWAEVLPWAPAHTCCTSTGCVCPPSGVRHCLWVLLDGSSSKGSPWGGVDGVEGWD